MLCNSAAFSPHLVAICLSAGAWFTDNNMETYVVWNVPMRQKMEIKENFEIVPIGQKSK